MASSHIKLSPESKCVLQQEPEVHVLVVDAGVSALLCLVIGTLHSVLVLQFLHSKYTLGYL